MKLRVLCLSTLYPHDQAPNFGIFVARQLAAVVARGDVDLVLVSPLGLPPFPLSLHRRYRALRDLPLEEYRDGVRILRPRFRLLPGLGAGRNFAAIAKAVLPVARKLHAEQPFDLIDAQFFHPDGAAAAAIARTLNLPLSIKARGADIHHWGRNPATAPALLRAADQAAGMLAVSQALRDDMVAMGMTAERITVHHTGLDHTRFYPRPRAAARAALALPKDGPLLVCTGALIERKGQALAIEALTHLPNARLALAGAGPDEAKLRDLIAQKGLTDRVYFHGSVPHNDLPKLLAAADVMVLPSASEGLANAWVEALACGTPIVIPDIGGAREVVTADTAGRIAARDPLAIAEAVQALLANPPAQAEVAKHAAAFSWEANAANLVNYWRGLIKV